MDRRLALLVSCSLLLLPTGCGIDSRPLRFGYNDFPPYTQIETSGSPGGMAVEVINQAAARAGVRVEWVRINPGESDIMLANGRIDAYPLMTITPERQAAWHFTAPWWSSQMGLLARAGEHPLDAGQVRGWRIAVRERPVEKALAYKALKNVHVVIVPTVEEQFARLCSGQVDALFLDIRVIQMKLLERPVECRGPLALAPVAEAEAMLATVSRVRDSRAHAIEKALAHLAMDGTLARIAAHWSLAHDDAGFARNAALAHRQEGVVQVSLAAAVLMLGLGFWQFRRMARSEAAARTARRRAEDSEERFESFMRHAPAIAFMRDEDGRFVYANDAYANMMGMHRAELEGRHVSEVYSPELAAQFIENDARVRREMKALELHEQLPLGGRMLDWLTLKFPMNGAGGQLYVGGVGVDVTRQKRAESEMREAQERYRWLFERAPVAYHELDSGGIIRQVNDAECRMLGRRREELLGHHVSEFVDPSEETESRAAVVRKLSGQQALVPFRRGYRRSDNTTVRCEVHEALVREGSTITGMHSTMIDVTERERTERLECDYKRVLELITSGERLTVVFRAVAEMVEQQLEGAVCGIEMLNDEASSTARDDTAFGIRVSSAQGSGAAFIRLGGPRSRRDEESHSRVLPLAQGLVRLAIDHRSLLDQLRYRAHHDALTGLPNRYVIEQALSEFIQRAAGEISAVLYIDLDGFKWINDSFGHSTGDKVLTGVAERLTAAVRRSDLVARVGGDEFVVLLHALQVEQEAALVAEKIIESLVPSFRIDEHDVYISPSIGIAAFPRHGSDLQTLLTKADQAMYQAKQAGKNRYVYTTEARS